MKTELKLQYVTRKDTTTPEFCRAFLDVLINRHPPLAPEIYDTSPEHGCRKPFVSVEDALPSWAWRGVMTEANKGVVTRHIPFVQQNYLKRKNGVKYYATVNHTDRTTDGDLIHGLFSFYVTAERKMDWLGVFRDLTRIIEPVLGRMHIFLGPEAKGFAFDSPQMLFLAGPGEPEMNEGLTNLGGANVFSEEYAPEVDETRLLDHGFAVETVGAGKLFHVTDTLFDVVDDLPKFSRRRAELKSLFRPGMFQIVDEPVLTRDR